MKTSRYLGKLKSVVGSRVYSLFDGGEKSNGTRKEIAAIVFNHERAAADTIVEAKMVRTCLVFFYNLKQLRLSNVFFSSKS